MTLTRECNPWLGSPSGTCPARLARSVTVGTTWNGRCVPQVPVQLRGHTDETPACGQQPLLKTPVDDSGTQAAPSLRRCVLNEQFDAHGHFPLWTIPI